MAGRPRTVPDEVILDAAGRANLRLGPARLTLADVAGEVGLAPATLVQRFGSKRGLLLAHATRAAETVGAALRAGAPTDATPLAALVEGLVALAQDIAAPDTLANSVGTLLLDLTDADFHAQAAAYIAAQRGEIARLLAAAVRAGELVPTDVGRLARAVQTTFNGATIVWALDDAGTLAERIRDELGLLLAPYAGPCYTPPP